ncbi:MAG: nucleoside diphosphate kinase regulator [Phyllobacterium sp.]
MTKAPSQKKPKIIVGDVDHARLTGLAEGALDRIPEIADQLLSELDRAKVVKQSAVPASIIRMGSTADIKIGDAEPRRVTLVFPDLADIAEGKISVLTPFGTALIGLGEGQSFIWAGRDGKKHDLVVLAVHQPSQEAA